METTIMENQMEKKMETTIMENQMEKTMENEMETGGIYNGAVAFEIQLSCSAVPLSCIFSTLSTALPTQNAFSLNRKP